MSRSWPPSVAIAKDIVDCYPYRITLRQLTTGCSTEAAALGYRNTTKDYDMLSDRTAVARRDGNFPALLDQTRSIHLLEPWASPGDAMASIISLYRRPRDEGQNRLIVLGGEKATLLAQLSDWFEDLGLPIVLLRGYGSQTHVDNVYDLTNRASAASRSAPSSAPSSTASAEIRVSPRELGHHDLDLAALSDGEVSDRNCCGSGLEIGPEV